MLVFLAAFAVFLGLLSAYYLIPAFEAARTAVPVERKELAAYSALLLVVVLVVLLLGLMLTFRVRRFFGADSTGRGERTGYVDAWKEAGKRMRSRPLDDDEG